MCYQQRIFDYAFKENNKLVNERQRIGTDIPVKELKQNTEIFGVTFVTFYVCIDEGMLPAVLKHANIAPVVK